MNRAEAAKKAAKEAGELLLSYLGKEKKFHFKAERDVSAEADKKSEALLQKILIEDGFQQDDFLSEESPYSEKPFEYRWIVDPIDGTGNFVHENPLFAVSIGLQRNDELILGAIYSPMMDEFYFAEKGKGAFLNGKKIAPSKKEDFYDLSLAVEMAPKEDLIRKTLLIEKGLAIKHRVRTLGSVAIDLAFVAAGRFDAFLSAYLYIWDAAGGIAILEEAGGKASHFSGEAVNLKERDFNLAASNGILQDNLLEKLK